MIQTLRTCCAWHVEAKRKNVKYKFVADKYAHVFLSLFAIYVTFVYHEVSERERVRMTGFETGNPFDCNNNIVYLMAAVRVLFYVHFIFFPSQLFSTLTSTYSWTCWSGQRHASLRIKHCIHVFFCLCDVDFVVQLLHRVNFNRSRFFFAFVGRMCLFLHQLCKLCVCKTLSIDETKRNRKWKGVLKAIAEKHKHFWAIDIIENRGGKSMCANKVKRRMVCRLHCVLALYTLLQQLPSHWRASGYIFIRV